MGGACYSIGLFFRNGLLTWGLLVTVVILGVVVTEVMEEFVGPNLNVGLLVVEKLVDIGFEVGVTVINGVVI